MSRSHPDTEIAEPVPLHIGVRALCEFTARSGDLDLRFTPAPTAQEGIAGHTLVAARRGPGYRTEVTLSGEYQGLCLRGRADGYDPVRRRLEEVKTYRGRLDRLPENQRALHWAQAKIYGALLCQAEQLAEVEIALVYFDIGSARETVLTERFAAAALQAFFVRQCEAYLAWARQERAHRAARDAGLAALSFPFPEFRAGQRRLAEAVYRTAAAGGCLLAEAPTGIGKTLGTLFPLLKAMPGSQLDKIFFLAARTTGRRLALDAAQLFAARAPALPLRVLELVARDKACPHPELDCHGESCPLACGFYDRLLAARLAALGGPLDHAAVRATAQAHAVCPYYLAQELARWADLIVGDYNYYFDLHALLYALTVADGGRVGVLVDEAHNLIERGRQMYSAELDPELLRQAQRAAPAPLKTPLARVRRAWNEAVRAQTEAYRAYPAPPAKLLAALQNAGAAVTDYLSEHPGSVDPRLQEFHFAALHFSRLAELFDAHSLFDVELLPGGRRRARLCLRNLVPAPFLAPRFAAAQATVLFSATLRPAAFYRDLLGLPAATPRLEVPSPFRAGQLAVCIAARISTRFRDRGASLTPIVELIAGEFARRPGNYLAFFSSFDYLEQVADLFAAAHADVPIWRQARRMDEAAREAFLARFTPTGSGIGFAVLGGVFGEGIDLPGERLIGAFIATLGLPQVNPVNEELRKRLHALFGAGYDYAYLYPGVQKVVQAAGRVIRGEADRGTVHLIDDRFARPEVRRLLPPWWEIESG